MIGLMRRLGCMLLLTFLFIQGKCQDIPTISSLNVKQDGDSSYVWLTWTVSSKPPGLTYEVVQKGPGYTLKRALTDSNATSYRMITMKKECVTYKLSVKPLLDGKPGVAKFVTFIFPRTPQSVVNLIQNSNPHDNGIVVSWEVQKVMKSCDDNFELRINRNESVLVKAKEYELKNLKPLVAYFVEVRVVDGQGLRGPWSSIQVVGRYGGANPDAVNFTIKSQPGEVKIEIMESVYIATTPVKKYVGFYEDSILGGKVDFETTKLEYSTINYQACEPLVVSLWQVTLDDISGPKSVKTFETEPYMPNKPVLTAVPRANLALLLWLVNEVPGNWLCKITYEAKMLHPDGTASYMTSSVKEVIFDMEGLPYGVYYFTVVEIANGQVRGPTSNKVEMNFVPRNK